MKYEKYETRVSQSSFDSSQLWSTEGSSTMVHLHKFPLTSMCGNFRAQSCRQYTTNIHIVHTVYYIYNKLDLPAVHKLVMLCFGIMSDLIIIISHTSTRLCGLSEVESVLNYLKYIEHRNGQICKSNRNSKKSL